MYNFAYIGLQRKTILLKHNYQDTILKTKFMPCPQEALGENPKIDEKSLIFKKNMLW